MKSLLSESRLWKAHPVQGSSSTDVVLLKTESKERAYVDTVDTDLSRTFQIPDEKPSGHCRYKAHPVLMLCIEDREQRKGLCRY